MRYVEVTKFGGPEVLALVEKEIPKAGHGMPLVKVQAAGVRAILGNGSFTECRLD
jgi:NADPH:quinone reductase-like Zn-dependent oxidoreductase